MRADTEKEFPFVYKLLELTDAKTVNSTNSNGVDALTVAIMSKFDAVVKAIFGKFGDGIVMHRDNFGNGPLNWILQHGSDLIKQWGHLFYWQSRSLGKDLEALNGMGLTLLNHFGEKFFNGSNVGLSQMMKSEFCKVIVEIIQKHPDRCDVDKTLIRTAIWCDMEEVACLAIGSFGSKCFPEDKINEILVSSIKMKMMELSNLLMGKYGDACRFGEIGMMDMIIGVHPRRVVVKVTPLMWCLANGMPTVALQIIRRFGNECKPGCIDERGKPH